MRAWSASHGKRSSESRPVNTVPWSPARVMLASSSGCWARPGRAPRVAASPRREPVAAALEGVGGQRDARGRSTSRPQSTSMPVTWASASERMKRSRPPSARRSEPDHGIASASCPAASMVSSTWASARGVGRPRRRAAPVGDHRRTASSKRTVWRRLRYQYSASIVAVSSRSPVTVEYNGTSPACGVIGANASSTSLAHRPRSARRVRGVVDGDPGGPARRRPRSPAIRSSRPRPARPRPPPTTAR